MRGLRGGSGPLLSSDSDRQLVTTACIGSAKQGHKSHTAARLVNRAPGLMSVAESVALHQRSPTIRTSRTTKLTILNPADH
jgi:hypothetical protein